MYCEHSDCKELAFAVIYWPDLPPIGLCELHYEAAKGVAIALDIKLVSKVIER